MRIALIGSSGYISEFLMRRFSKEQFIDSVVKMDINDSADVYLDLSRANEFDYSYLSGIDLVVFTAAISSPDKCANEFDECWQINVIGTSYFINEAIRKNCRVLFFSSDAVFGDIPGMIYDEESETRAETPYGRMKKAIEDKFKGEPLFKAIRLSYVASAKDRFYSYCMNCMINNVTAEIFHPFYRNVTVVSDVVDVVVFLAKNWSEYEPQLLNVAGKELVSRVRMADEMNRLYDGRLKYSITIQNDVFFKNRPAITQMRSLYAEKYNIYESNTFTEKIKREFEGIRI